LATKDLTTNDSSRQATKPKMTSAPIARPFATHATPAEAKDLDDYIWGAMTVVAIMSLLGFSIMRILIKQGRVWDRVMR
jgi:hypothetical protein